MTASGDGRGPVPYVTAAIIRAVPDIAFIIAGGVDTEGGALDALVVSMVPEPGSMMLLTAAVVGLVAARRRRDRTTIG